MAARTCELNGGRKCPHSIGDSWNKSKITLAWLKREWEGRKNGFSFLPDYRWTVNDVDLMKEKSKHWQKEKMRKRYQRWQMLRDSVLMAIDEIFRLRSIGKISTPLHVDTLDVKLLSLKTFPTNSSRRCARWCDIYWQWVGTFPEKLEIVKLKFHHITATASSEMSQIVLKLFSD